MPLDNMSKPAIHFISFQESRRFGTDESYSPRNTSTKKKTNDLDVEGKGGELRNNQITKWQQLARNVK